MKAKTIVSITAAAAVVASFTTTVAWTKGAPGESGAPPAQTDRRATLPIGSWRVTFENGVVQNCDILADGKATVVQSQRTSDGNAEVKGSVVEIRFDDDRLELWTQNGSSMVVEHWHPSASMSEKPPITGTATRLFPGEWNDRISSVKAATCT